MKERLKNFWKENGKFILFVIGIFILLLIIVGIANAIPDVRINESIQEVNIIPSKIPRVQLTSPNYTGNLSDVYVKKSGDTMSGDLSFTAGTNILAGLQDVFCYDANPDACFGFSYLLSSGGAYVFKDLAGKVVTSVNLSGEINTSGNTFTFNGLTGETGGIYGHIPSGELEFGFPRKLGGGTYSGIRLSSSRGALELVYADNIVVSLGLLGYHFFDGKVNASSFNVRGDIKSETAGNSIVFPDNSQFAYHFKEGAIAYQSFDTRNGQEEVSFGKNVSLIHNLKVGNGVGVQKNITMYSPDNTEFTCGVDDSGGFSCT